MGNVMCVRGDIRAMKISIGVLSDTHLKHVTGDLRQIYNRYLSDRDLVLHAGDVVSTEIVDFLEKKDFHAVHGNMDPCEVQELLPGKKVIELGPYRIGLIHGWGPSAGLEDRVRQQFGEVDVIVYGHSHIAANHIREGVLFFNPGAATGFSRSGIHTMGVLELGDAVHGEIIIL